MQHRCTSWGAARKDIVLKIWIETGDGLTEIGMRLGLQLAHLFRLARGTIEIQMASCQSICRRAVV